MNRPTASTALPRASAVSLAPDDDFSALAVLSEGTRLWLLQLPAFAGLALLLHAPLLAAALLPSGFDVAVFVAGELLVSVLVKAVLARAVIDAQRSLQTSFVELLEALSAAPRAAALGVRILAVAVTRLVLVVPGVKYLCDTFIAVPALVIEERGAGPALRTSILATRGVRLSVFGLCLATWSLALAFSWISGIYEPERLNNPTWVIVYLVARSLDRSLAAVLAATAYSHLRDRTV
jgi:hypothetical protein